MKNLFAVILLVIITFSNNIMAKDRVHKEAIFAMGCFWCGAAAFTNHDTDEKLPGIISIRVGYTGGKIPAPTYQNHKGHKEAVKITYDPKIISYSELLNIFWHNIDPFDAKGQFCDKGFAYSAAIFYQNKEQLSLAQESKRKAENELGNQFVTEILSAGIFYDAEEYHQNYKIKNPKRYKYYFWRCGRAQRLNNVWKTS